MNEATVQSIVSSAPTSPVSANHAYLEAEFERIRLLLARRVRWIRWSQANCSLPGFLSPGDVEEAGFNRDDPEARAITARLAECESELAEHRASMAAGGVPLAIDVMSQLFELSPFDRDVLLLCGAAELVAGFGALCAWAQDDPNSRYPTPELALEIFAPNREACEAARESFLPSSPLRRFRLIALAESVPGLPHNRRAVSISARIADYLRGVNHLDEALAYLVRPLAGGPLAGAQRTLVDSLVKWAGGAYGLEAFPVLNFTGAPGIGKRLVAAEFCARVGLRLFSLDTTRLPAAHAERHDLVHLLQREAALSQVALYIDASELDAPDRVQQTREWMEQCGGIVILASRERWQLDRAVYPVAIPRLDAEAQRQIWTRSLDGAASGLQPAIENIVQQFSLGPRAIPQVCRAAVARARVGSPSGETAQPAASDLWQACREWAGWRIGDLARPIFPSYSWDDIVLPADAMQQLHEIAGQVGARGQVYDAWGFGSHARGRGITALFSGPSGAGKTMAAEILARHLELDLYRIDLAGVVSKYIGETEKNLRNVFDAAEQSGAILFFDEADALFGKRSEVKDSHDRYANIEINYLLQRMEDYRGVAILCTNRRSALDRAFLRRLRFIVEFPFPDCADRKLIWQKVFPPSAPAGGLDFDALSRLELTGGNIRNIALNAAFLAAAEAGPIDMQRILRAARREYVKIDKMIAESEFGAYYREVSQ